jgi:hypothetical protein
MGKQCDAELLSPESVCPAAAKFSTMPSVGSLSEAIIFGLVSLFGD